MKYLLNLITFSLLTLSAFSQQVNDALLLDYYQNQRYLEAANYLKSIYPESTTDLKALSRLAYTSQMAGKLPDAEGYYQRILNIDSTSTSVLYNLAALNQRRGNNNKAEIYYKKILSKDSTDFQVYKQLATISHNKADMISKLVYLQKANKIDSIDFDVASDLSDLYVNLKQFPQAEKVLNTAIAADPENVILLQSLLKLTYAQKKWPQAVKAGEQLLQLGDLSQSPKLGIAYYHAKNYLCALETLMAIDESAQTEVTSYFTAASYKQLKDQKTAIKYFKKAVKLSISFSIDTYYNEMADSYQILGKYETAETTFKKGLLYDQKPMTYYAMATLYDTKLKQPKNALAYFKKYLAAKPDEDQKEYVEYSKNRIKALSVH
ncbi:MAG: tetratricopeptide repeat protein [Sphingobacteriaceae bacterium]|nr:MAG: tetratricopeptide repeat protein [Sphingobacteriaceae bacterium]